jgi:hypothetical protein
MPEHVPTKPSQATGSRTVPCRRVLHVVIPDFIFNHAKSQAALSGMAFKTYLERLLLEASPYAAEDVLAGKAMPTSPPPPSQSGQLN